MPPKKTNAVNSIVSDLIRAAAGSSARNVSDQDVDKYVADLILKEAEEKRKKYNDIGVKAYQPNTPPSQKPKPNTRFLLNMVKATDSHNQAVIKANEDNAARLRKERLERERLDREKEGKRRHSRHEDKSHRHSKRSRSTSRSRTPPREKRSKHHTSRHHGHKRRSPSPSISKKEKEAQDIQYKGRGKVRINVSSMDKYFSKGYDPLLDVESDQEEYVFAETEAKQSSKKDKKKKKKSNKKKKKKYSSSESDCSDSSTSSTDIGPKPAVVRAWDVGKDISS